MLIDFTVENFRSFANAQTFSLIASKDSSHEQNVIRKGDFRLLKTTAVFGANASGKSNLMKSIGLMERFVRDSATKLNLDDPISWVEPFRLGSQWQTKPSSFAIRLLVNGTEYQYGFAATQERVHKEWLRLKRANGRETPVLLREYDAASGTTRWRMRGRLKEQASAAVKATRDNGLFLSHAAQMNVEFVKELFRWLRHHVWYFDLSSLPTGVLLQQTAKRISEDPVFRARVEKLVHDADLGISAIAAREEAISFDDAPKQIRDWLLTLPKPEHYSVQTFHTLSDSLEPVAFSLEGDESLGTQRFFGIIGRILQALDNGDVLIIDELDCSMHPLLIQKLIELFQNNEANPNGAQLLFAIHDSSLMSQFLLRRDQIWFTEKDAGQATQLFSLCDIERTPRKREAFQKNYLAGRYGGVPSFGPALEDYEVR